MIMSETIKMVNSVFFKTWDIYCQLYLPSELPSKSFSDGITIGYLTESCLREMRQNTSTTNEDSKLVQLFDGIVSGVECKPNRVAWDRYKKHKLVPLSMVKSSDDKYFYTIDGKRIPWKGTRYIYDESLVRFGVLILVVKSKYLPKLNYNRFRWSGYDS